ncbi:hypothetical protein [Vibrio nigripulchritudo]|nr:hypothetical protein [Vibrio nigripulchritudo]BDU42890.1 hypothetical protein TUMSATVNIG3_16880 [Vibrio nigripulchritudo]
MKFTKATVVPMLVTAGLTIGLLAAVNNLKPLEKVKKTINGDGGWF